MKRIAILILCLVLLFAMTVPASAEGSIHLSVSGGGTVYRGNSITFYITASGGGSCASFGLYLSYDSSVFEYAGGSASAGGALIADMSASGLAVAYNGTGTPSGTVGSFTLRVRDSAPFGTFSVSGSASAQGAGASASGTSVTVACNHSYGDWSQYSADYHQKTCGICFSTQEEGHVWNEGTVTKDPSCKEEGSKAYTCIVCGESKNEILGKTDNHNYGAFQKVDNTNHQAACGICGGVLTVAHTWDGGTVTKQETCKATGTKLFTCTGCGTTREETIPISQNHPYSAWAKVDEAKHKHTCGVCGKEETVGHDWNGGSVTKKPNCTETGSCLYTCNGCGATKTEEMPITGVHTYDHGCDQDCNICGDTRTTYHSYSSSWSKNASQHWKVCTSCGHKADVSSHVPGEEATEYNPQVCTVCNYILKPELAHEHSYAEELTIDETGHWYACKGCEEKKDYADHDFDNDCDGLCETCQYTRETSHDISEEWYADYVNHFQKCVSCGKEEEHIRHTPGPKATELEPQTCEVCGFVLMPAFGHKFSDTWSSDELTHYHICDCGEKADVAEHIWDEGVRSSEGTLFTCRVCSYQKLKPLDLSWLIYVAVGVAAAAGAIWFFVKKKKQTPSQVDASAEETTES